MTERSTIQTAMVLAAGRGERMRPLTDHTPKPLLDVKGRSLLVRHLERLSGAGIKRVVINHAWLGEKIVQALPSGTPYGVEICFSAEQPVQETAGGIIQALPLLGNAPFLLVNGDIYTDMDYGAFIQSATAAERSRPCHLMLVDNPAHNPAGDFTLRDTVVGQGQPGLTYGGMGIYHPGLFAGIPAGPRPLGPLLRLWQQAGKVSGIHYPGYWCDVGTPERLAQVRGHVQQQETE